MYNIWILAATPLEASSGPLNVFLYLKNGYFAFDVYFLLNSLSKIEKLKKKFNFSREGGDTLPQNS